MKGFALFAALACCTLPTLAAQRLAADTPLTTVQGTRFTAPIGWTMRVKGPAIFLAAPEGDSRITLLDVPQGEADAAVAATWAAHTPQAAPALKGALDRPARHGWTQVRHYRYRSAGEAQRTVYAQALGSGGRWTVALYDLSIAVAEKRDSQLELLTNTLLPAGYMRPTLAGKTAQRLDAARIAALTGFVETARQQFDIPGVALGLVQDGEVVFEGGFGLRALGKPEQVDADTAFLIASNNKPLTTLMLAKLVEAQKFSWNTPVTRLWPAFRLGDAATTRQLRVRHLVCACTGLPRQDYEWLFEGENATPASIVKTLSTMRPTSAFGELYQYSNLLAAAGGYLGGHVLHPGRELGAVYDAAMQQLVFDPLGMSATTFDHARAQAGNHAAPHGLDVDGRTTVASMDLNLAGVASRPDGGALSTTRDLLRYVQMELAQGLLPDGRRYIAESPLLARRQPQVAEGHEEHYGIGLKIDRTAGVTILRHGGSATGYRSDLLWLPEHGVGAVILTNSDAGSALRSAFRRRLLEVLFDAEPVIAADLAQQARRSKAGRLEERAELQVPPDPAQAGQLAARYHNAVLGQIEVRHEGGQTVFDFGGWDSEVATRQHAGGAVTFVTISPGEEGFEFTLADAGTARRLVLRDAQHEYVFDPDQHPAR